MSENCPDNQSVVEIAPVLSMSRVPTVHFGHQRFFSFWQQLALHAQSQLDQSRKGPFGRLRSITKQVVLTEAEPSTGKTFIERQVGQSMLPTMNHFAPSFSSVEDNPYIIRLNWEEHGEERARRAGKITTPKHDVYKLEECIAAQDYYEDSLVEAIDDDDSVMIMAEDPGGIGAVINGVWRIYRPLSAQVAHHLSRKSGKFEGKPIDLWVSAFTKSPILDVLGDGREEIWESPDLATAEQLAKMYGIIKEDHILTEEYRGELNNGASIRQRELIRRLYLKFVRDLSHTPQLQFARHMLAQQPKDLSVNPLFSDPDRQGFIHPYEMGAVWEYILSDHENLALASDRAFIGHYNLTPELLGLSPEKLKLLSEHWKQMNVRKKAEQLKAN